MSWSRARSVPECGAAGAQGWNIDCRTSTLVVTHKYKWSSAPQWNVVVVGVGVRDTLLGPEGSDDTHVLVTVALGVAGCWWVCAGWFLLVVGLADARVFARVGVGCRLYVENFTVDASIFSSVQVFKGTRWMPWHQEPKKDVGICDKPRVVDNQTVIRGFPNGETRLEASPVTRT